jgi:hypothetical protein
LIEITGERIELLGPELLVARHPGRGRLHRRGAELAAHHAAFLVALDEPGVLEHAQVLHEPGQRHVVGRRELAYREIALAKRIEDAAPRRVRQGGEHGIERGALILNHQV